QTLSSPVARQIVDRKLRLLAWGAGEEVASCGAASATASSGCRAASDGDVDTPSTTRRRCKGCLRLDTTRSGNSKSFITALQKALKDLWQRGGTSYLHNKLAHKEDETVYAK
ncbi:hypothetical protein EJB05_21937, partial [Eragrostis curvula]